MSTSSSSSSSSDSSDDEKAPALPEAALVPYEDAAPAPAPRYNPGLPPSRASLNSLLRQSLDHRTDARLRFEAAKDALRSLAKSQRDGTIYTAQDPRMAISAEYDMRSGLEPWGQVRRRPIVKPKTGPLTLIFEFYARMQEPGAQLGKDRTMTMIKDCNERLSFFEVVCFARDFDIVPKLITKSTLAYLHKVSSALPNRSETSQREGQDVRDAGFDLEEFNMLLVRIALVAFAERSVGDPEVAVRCLIRWMHLDDPPKVRNVVHTRGRQTQRRINFRSKGEVDNTAAARALRDKKDEMLLRLKALSPKHKVDYTRSQVQRVRDFDYKVDDLTRVNNLLQVSQQILLASFKKDTAKLLDPYVASKPVHHWCPFDDCGIDCGRVLPSITYATRIHVCNRSDETLTVCGLDISGDATDALSARFDPRPFAPGMTRFVELNVRPSNKMGEFSSTVELKVGRDKAPSKNVNALGTHGDTYVAVPVFYRVGGPGHAPRRRPASAGAIRTTLRVRRSFKAVVLDLPDRVAGAIKPRIKATDSQSSRSASPSGSSSSSSSSEDDEPLGLTGGQVQ